MPKLYEVTRSTCIKAGQIVEVVGFVSVDKVIMAICLWEGILLDVPFGHLILYNPNYVSKFLNKTIGEGFESAENLRNQNAELFKGPMSEATEVDKFYNPDSIGFLYISFGQDHGHKLGNQVFDKDCIAEIPCKTIAEGRKIAFDLFGGKFFTSYIKDELPDLKHFPRGIIKTEVACNRLKKYQCPEYEKFMKKEINKSTFNICTKENPYDHETKGKWQHPDANSVKPDDAYYDHYLCPHCNLEFSIEVAE